MISYRKLTKVKVQQKLKLKIKIKNGNKNMKMNNKIIKNLKKKIQFKKIKFQICNKQQSKEINQFMILI